MCKWCKLVKVLRDDISPVISPPSHSNVKCSSIVNEDKEHEGWKLSDNVISGTINKKYHLNKFALDFSNIPIYIPNKFRFIDKESLNMNFQMKVYNKN